MVAKAPGEEAPPPQPPPNPATGKEKIETEDQAYHHHHHLLLLLQHQHHHHQHHYHYRPICHRAPTLASASTGKRRTRADRPRPDQANPPPRTPKVHRHCTGKLAPRAPPPKKNNPPPPQEPPKNAPTLYWQVRSWSGEKKEAERKRKTQSQQRCPNGTKNHNTNVRHEA